LVGAGEEPCGQYSGGGKYLPHHVHQQQIQHDRRRPAQPLVLPQRAGPAGRTDGAAHLGRRRRHGFTTTSETFTGSFVYPNSATMSAYFWNASTSIPLVL